MNIYEYIENSQINYPFMSDSFLNTTVDNPTSTAEFQELLKNYIYENFGIYQISPLIVMRENSTEKSFDDIISEISTLVYKANEYRYNTLYSTIIQEYDPIENYKMIEEITVNYQGDEKTVNQFIGKEKSTINYKGEESTVDSKSGTDTNVLTKSGTESNSLSKSGSENVNESDTRGDVTTTTKKAPFDSENFYNESQDLTSQSKADVKNTTTTFTDRVDNNTTTYANRTDNEQITYNSSNNINKSFNGRSDENIKEFDGRADEILKSFMDRKDVTTHTRSGNIGVTTSQQMLESQRLLANFKFVDIVARDIVKKIAILLY